jgi:type III secretion protein C
LLQMCLLRSVLTSRFRKGLVLLTILGVASASTALWAQSIPFKRERTTIEGKGEAVSTFVVRLLSGSGIPVSVSGLVSGTITAKFDRTDQAIFNELVSAYGLVAYYDGAMVYVYSSAEITTKLLPASKTSYEQLVELAAELKVLDTRFPLKLSSAAAGTLRVSGPPRYVELVESLLDYVKQASGPKRVQVVRVFPLKHATAADRTVTIGTQRTAVQGVAAMLNALIDEGGVIPQLPFTVDRSLSPVQSIRNGGGNPSANVLVPDRGVLARNASGESATSSIQDSQQRYSSRNRDGSESAVRNVDDFLSARGVRPSVKADIRTNAVVVRDLEERMQLFETLIGTLDVPVSMVEIEVKILDVSTGVLRSLGTDFSAVLTNIVGRAASPVAGLSAARATIVLANEKNSLLAQINALQSNGEASVQSSPRVSTLDNHEAVLQATQDLHVRVAGFQQVDLYPISVGLTMRVTPTVTHAAGVYGFRLAVNIDDGSLGEAQVDQIPVINRTSLSTNVVVGDGESLLIGGLISERKSDSNKGLPYVSDVPILKYLFSTDTKDSRRSERLFLITPKRILPVAPAKT